MFFHSKIKKFIYKICLNNYFQKIYPLKVLARSKLRPASPRSSSRSFAMSMADNEKSKICLKKCTFPWIKYDICLFFDFKDKSTDYIIRSSTIGQYLVSILAYLKIATQSLWRYTFWNHSNTKLRYVSQQDLSIGLVMPLCYLCHHGIIQQIRDRDLDTIKILKCNETVYKPQFKK